MDACARLRPDSDRLADPTQATKAALRSIAQRARSLRDEIKALDKQILALLAATAPATLAVFAMGPDTAAALLVTVASLRPTRPDKSNPTSTRQTQAESAIAKAIAGIDENVWVGIGYTLDGEAQVAECVYGTGKGRQRVERRLIVRRTRLTDTTKARLWPDWRHHAFLTDLDGDTVTLDAFHRQHAVVELAIRDLKEGAGLEHVPSGQFFANAAWLGCAVLAHNLIRWSATLGGVTPDGELIVARTIRTRLIALPGRIVNRSGQPTLRLPARWPWAVAFPRARTPTRDPTPRLNTATDHETATTPGRSHARTRATTPANTPEAHRTRPRAPTRTDTTTRTRSPTSRNRPSGNRSSRPVDRG